MNKARRKQIGLISRRIDILKDEIDTYVENVMSRDCIDENTSRATKVISDISDILEEISDDLIYLS